MSRLEQIVELENRYLLPTYNRYPVALEKGKGVFLYDFEGKKYLDFVAGLGVNALGHAHPRIVKAIQRVGLAASPRPRPDALQLRGQERAHRRLSRRHEADQARGAGR